jgi:hypothetical protein
MGNTKGYVDPLLTALTVDYSKGVREKLIGSRLFPRVKVPKSSGKFARFDKGNIMRVVDDTLAEDGFSRKLPYGGTMEPYSTDERGLSDDYDLAEASQREGPFALKDQQIVERIVTQLEINQESRIATKVAALAGRATALAGVGAAKANKFAYTGANTGGDPFTAISDGIKACFWRPNLMIIADSVFDALEYHPILLDKLGEANMIKKVDEDTLAKLFRVQKVVRAEGKADFGKPKADGSLNLTNLWGNSVIIAYVDERPDFPCAGKTLAVDYPEADSAGYIVRAWDEERAGLRGKRVIQVGYDVDELVVCPELIYTISSCI